MSGALPPHVRLANEIAIQFAHLTPADAVARWLTRNLGRLEAIDADHTRLVATTDEPDWYVRQLTAIEAPFRIVGPPELLAAADRLAGRLVQAAAGPR